MSIVYYNSSPLRDNMDFDKITELLFKKERRKIFLSDWNSDNNIEYLNDIYIKSFEKSLQNIDYYYSSEHNKCQEIICNYLHTYYNISFLKKQIIVGNNATSLISFYIVLLSSLGIKNYIGLSPIYYSFIDAIKISNSNIVIYQMGNYNNEIIINDIEKAIKKYKIQAIIITDPIFCFGIKLNSLIWDELISLANKYGCYIIADLTREGLSWNSDNDELIINNTIVSIYKAYKFAAIYSPCKKVFANSVKTAILLTSDEKIDYIFSYQDSFIGSISSIQIEFLNLLFDDENSDFIATKIKNNKMYFISNFEKINSILLGSRINLFKPDGGNFAIAKVTKEKYNDKEIFELLYNELDIISLPLSLYNYFDVKNYLFRINLSIKSSFLIDAALKLLTLEEYF